MVIGDALHSYEGSLLLPLVGHPQLCGRTRSAEQDVHVSSCTATFCCFFDGCIVVTLLPLNAAASPYLLYCLYDIKALIVIDCCVGPMCREMSCLRVEFWAALFIFKENSHEKASPPTISWSIFWSTYSYPSVLSTLYLEVLGIRCVNNLLAGPIAIILNLFPKNALLVCFQRWGNW